MVWGQMVALPVIWMFLKLILSDRHVHAAAGGFSPHHLGSLFISAVRFGIPTEEYLIGALNIPAIAIDLLVDLATTFPESWHPALLTVFQWRAICYPFFSLPFWWFAGVGVDGLLRRRVLRWFSLVPGTLLAALFLIGLAGETFGLPPNDRKGTLYFAMMSGILLWALLFAAFPASWIRNRRIKAVS
jgi:hypothetical protein